MPPQAASKEDIKKFLQEHDAWTLKNDKLHREFLFVDFVQAFSFISQIALIAERNNHHPEWSNVYRKVVIDLTTHEAHGISDLDFTLAMEIDKIAFSMQGRQ